MNEADTAPGKVVTDGANGDKPVVERKPVAERIRAFLDGESDGAELLHDLYDHILDEDIPPELRARLKR